MAGNKAIFDTAMKRAHEYAWANQWERAMKEYGRALSEFPDDRTALRNMAQCLFRLRQWPKAQAAYEDLMKSDPDDLFALNRLAEIHLALNKQDKAFAVYMRLADLYTQKNQFHEAIRSLRDLARAMPKNKEVHTRLLELSQEVGDRQAQAAEHIALSEIELEEGRRGEAQGHADAASSLDPDNPEVRRWSYTIKRRMAESAGTVVFDSAEIEGAHMQAVPGTGMLPPSEEPPEAVELVERAMEAQGRGEFREAMELYDNAVKAGARRPSVFYSAGLLNQQMGRPDVAVPYLERAQHDPEFAMSSNYVIGQCYFSQRLYPKAVSAFERALTLINMDQISRNEADELIELYTATAEAHLADNNPGRASSLYSNLVTVFKERRFNHPKISEMERRAEDLYNKSIQSKLLGISRGSSSLDPDRLPDLPPVAPFDATRIDMGTGDIGVPTISSHVPHLEEGGTSIMGGTDALPNPQSATRIPQSDNPTQVMRSAAGALRSITEFLRASSVNTGPTNTPHSALPTPHSDDGTTALPPEGTIVLSGTDAFVLNPQSAILNPQSIAALPDAMLADIQQQSLLVQRLIAEGERAMSESQWDVAIDSCMAIIVAEPGYLPVHIMLGDIYLHEGRIQEAVTKYQTVMDTFISRGDSENAAEVCRRLLQLEPDNPTIQSRLGILLMEAGKVDDAAKALLSVAERHYTAGNPERALEEAEALKLKLPNSSEVALASGTYLLALGRYQDALTELSRALHLDPGNDAALVRLYITLCSSNEVSQWDALESILERAAKNKGDNRLFMEEMHTSLKARPLPSIYYGLAVLAARSDLFDIAADALDQGILQMATADTQEIDKSWLFLEVLMRQYRGDIALTSKDGAVAAQHYARVLDILKTHGGLEEVAQGTGELAIQSPRPQYEFTRLSEPIQLYYGLAEANASQNNWEGAMGALQALKQIMPNDYSVYTRLADIYFRQGQLNQALAELNDLLVLFQKVNDTEKTLETLGHMARLAPNNVAVRRKLSDMYLKLGMTEYGLRELNTLAELQLKAGLLKDAMRTYQKAADLHYTLGQHDKAISIYERIVRIAPRDIEARHYLLNMYVQSGKIKEAVEGERSLAEVFIQEGRTEEAIAALHQLLALAPEDIPGHHLLAKQLTALGEYGQAARLYGRLLRLEPNNDRLPVLQSEMQRMAREKEDETTTRNTGPMGGRNTGPTGGRNTGPTNNRNTGPTDGRKAASVASGRKTPRK
jgi:tetratricopeptide (TPR) repeat protein